MDQTVAGYQDQGLQAFLVLIEDNVGQPPTASYCQTWRAANTPNMELLYDPTGAMAIFGPKETSLVVDAAGRIALKIVGDEKAPIESAIQQELSGADDEPADAPEPSPRCDPHALLDGADPGCDGAAALELLSAMRRPIEPCRLCHDMTVIGAPKFPGPPWWHPTDDEAMLRAMLDLGLIAPDDPHSSLLLLKPLATEDGGATHEGGALLTPSDPLYALMLDFLTVAGGCVSCPGGLPKE